MTQPIKNELSMQLYGDIKLQEKLLQVMADAFDEDVSVKSEKDYETKYGRTGHYMQIKIKLSDK